MSERLKVAVVGGGIGTQHIDAYRELADRYEVTAFCDIQPDKAQAVAAQYGIATVTTQFDELLAMPELDLIDLCTPPGLHVAQITAALQAGKHVVCEKPLAASLAEIDGLAAAEARAGKVICPIFQYRFGNGFARLLHLREQGVLGRCYLATVETHWRRGPAYFAVPWRGRFATELGGCLVSHAIHTHDMLMCALGPAVSLHARVATRVNDIEVEDCAVLSLEMGDGTLAALSVTLGNAGEHSRLRFYFERATVESHLSPYRPHLEPWRFEPMGDEARQAIERALADFAPQPEHFAGQFARLHHAITAGGPLPVNLNDSRRAIELFTAAYYSAEHGEAVPLPLHADHPAYHGWPERDDGHG